MKVVNTRQLQALEQGKLKEIELRLLEAEFEIKLLREKSENKSLLSKVKEVLNHELF